MWINSHINQPLELDFCFTKFVVREGERILLKVIQLDNSSLGGLALFRES